MTGEYWLIIEPSGIFCAFGNANSPIVGSQTLIIIVMTVMTDKLSIKYMVVFMHMLAGQVSFMMRICNRSMQEQVLQSNLHIIILLKLTMTLSILLFVVHLIQIGMEIYHVLLWESLLVMLNLLFGLV